MADDNGVFDNLGSSILSVAGRFLEGTIDTLPKIHPVGGIVQAVANTDAYKTQQLEKQVRKEELLQKQYELAQKKLNRPLQEEINKKTLLQKQHELAMAELNRPTDELNAQYNKQLAQYKLDNFDADTEALKLDREAGNAKNRQTLIDMQTAQEVAPLERELKKQKLEMQMAELDANKELLPAQRELARRKTERELRVLDEDDRREAIEKYKPQLEEALANHPGFRSMTLDEQQAFLNSPQVEAALETPYWEEKYKQLGEDPEAVKLFDRTFRRNGLELIDASDGRKMVKLPDGGLLSPDPATVETIKKANMQKLFEELDANTATSYNNTRGNPANRAVAKYAREYSKYGDSLANARKRIMEIVAPQQSSSPAHQKEQIYLFLDQAMDDFNDPSIAPEDKMAEIQACVQFLPALGFTAIPGQNPDDVSSYTFFPAGGDRGMSFIEFRDHVKENNSMGARLENDIARTRDNFFRRQKDALQREIELARYNESLNAMAQEENRRSSDNKNETDNSDWFSEIPGE